MLNLITRWAFIACIWNKHHKVIKVLCLCSPLVLLIFVLHSEYIAYCNISDTKTCAIGLSFTFKWIGILSIILVAIVLSKYKHPAPSSAHEQITRTRLRNPQKSDGFDEIRNKKRLLSRGDILILSKPNR